MKHISIGLAEQYAMQELSTEESAQLEAHVSSCGKCADLVTGQVGWANSMQLASKMRKAVKRIEKSGAAEK